MILIVEDDRAISQLLIQTLADDGLPAIAAGHGAEALNVLETVVPDAIVLDLNMPVMDGRTFMRELREHERAELRDIPVLVLTAEYAEQARREVSAAGAISKPFDIDRVAPAIRRVLVAAAAEDQQAASA